MSPKIEPQITIQFLNDALHAAQLSTSRGFLDVFADRLLKATSEPTLALAMEQLLRSLNVETTRMNPTLATRMVGVANSTTGPRILRWLRDQAKLVTMLASTKDRSLVDSVLAEIDLPTADQAGSNAVGRGAFPITLRVRCESPLAHGADGKAGNATLFRRIQVLATNGSSLELPYYAWNAVRGAVRDLLADHFLAAMGFPVDRAKPSVALWFFYALYSGGALEESSDAQKALKKQLGDNGAVRADGVRAFRDHLPGLSLLGCALGNRVLPGRVQFADLRPVCAEWGTGTRPVAEIMTWEFLTRREDHEGHEENHSMIANTEVLRTGTELEGGIDMDDAMPEIERSALGCGLALLAKRGRLGAENRRGFGRVVLDVQGAPDALLYENWLAGKRPEILAYLENIGATRKLL